MKENLNPLMPTEETIDNYRQNKVSYVVRDLQKTAGVEPGVSYPILLARGVFKWMSVRREMIRYKDDLKKGEKLLLELIKLEKSKKDKCNAIHLAKMRGALGAMQAIRSDMRGIFHSDRWQVQDNDRDAWKWLSEVSHYDTAQEEQDA